MARLIDTLQVETENFHAEADEDAIQLLGPVSPADYWRFLTRCYGFVTPVERAIVATPNLDQLLDSRRFRKHDLLRTDLSSFRMTKEEIDALPQCAMPLFDSPEEALGWAYVIERGTLGHNNLFRHLATVMPGQVAFSSSYLKCYFGAVGEMWRAFGLALDRFSESPARSRRVIESAKAAFRTYRSWRHHHDDHEDHDRDRPPSDSGEQQSA